MASAWDRFWLYVRLVALALIVVFAVQLFLINVNYHGSARLLVGTDWMGGVWALVAAFVLGALAVPLCRAVARAWRDYRADQAGRRQEIADEAVQKTLGRPPQSAKSSADARGAPPADADKGAATDKSGPADVWIRGDE